MNKVRRSGPPSISANGARFSASSTRCKILPPSATRTTENPPHRALGVHGDAVRAQVADEHAPAGQPAVAVDAERGQPARERLGDDQRPAVRGDDHAVGELDVIGELAQVPVRRDELDVAWLGRRAS